MTTTAQLQPGTRVVFAEGTPPFEANQGIVFVVCEQFTTSEDRECVWLVVEGDLDKAPGQQRQRSAFVAALVAA